MIFLYVGSDYHDPRHDDLAFIDSHSASDVEVFWMSHDETDNMSEATAGMADAMRIVRRGP